MVSPVIVQYGLPFLVQVLSDALSRVDSPVAQAASRSLGNVRDAMTAGRITPEQIAEANRHAEAMAALQADEAKTAFTQINESLRREIVSDDPYVRRMRPTFGYLMALTWAAQMFGVAYVVAFRTDQTMVVMNAMAALTPLWAMGLSVLGIYVYKRSEEKRSAGTRQDSSAFAPADLSRRVDPAAPALPPSPAGGFNLNP